MKKRTKYILLILCLFIVICSAVILIVYNFLAKPSGNSNDKFVPSTDADMYIDDDLYTSTPKKGSKVIDKDTGIQFVNNELIVYVKEGATQQDMDELLNENDAYVVGKNKTIGSYKLRFNKSYSYSELNELIEIVQQNEIIDEASLNLVIQYSTNEYYPTSKKDRWTNDWDSIPVGANWGIEAINTPRAWEYIDLMQEINVGIFDQGFDVDHEDLKDIVKNSSLYPGNPQDHGTHVTGIIGADFENGIGIDGVCPTAHFSLYNYSENDSDSDSFSYAMTYLVEYNNSKVINMSLGASPNIMFSAGMGEVSAQEYIKSISVICENTINQLLSNYDFVICRSAGNNRGYNYYKSNSATYGYYQADPDIPGNYFDNEGNSKKWNENSDPISGSEKVMANWDYLSLINDKGTKNHIITVGAVQNNSDNYPKYSLCSFSDIGGTDNDSIVDVVAPGYMIESTVPMSNNDGYEYKSGTSMASPHVAGVAAMLYSLDPDLMGDEVKQIICETATTEVDGYKLVDAEAAVIKVMGQGSLSANVVSSENDTSLSNVRVDAYIQLKSGEKLIDTGYTDSSGNLSMKLQGGNYEIRFNKDGYKTTATTIKISKDEITVLKDSIVMEKENNSVVTDEEKNTNANDTGKEKNINGTWVSVDKNYVFTFKVQEGSLGIDYNSGLSVASGVFNYVNINNGNDRINGSFNYTDINTIVATVNLSDGKSITFSFENDKLVSDNIVLEKIPNEVITQFEGTWQNSDEEITFDSDGEYKYKKDNYSTWGYYYVLSESNIILSNKSHDFKTYSYSIVDTQMSFSNGIIFNRITAGADADTLLSLKDIIVGTWEYSDFNEEYRIYNDGTWERYIVSYHGNQSEPMFENFLEGGTYKILNESQVELDKGFSFNILVYNKVTGALSGDGIILTKKS